MSYTAPKHEALSESLSEDEGGSLSAGGGAAEVLDELPGASSYGGSELEEDEGGGTDADADADGLAAENKQGRCLLEVDEDGELVDAWIPAHGEAWEVVQRQLGGLLSRPPPAPRPPPPRAATFHSSAPAPPRPKHQRLVHSASVPRPTCSPIPHCSPFTYSALRATTP